MTKVEQKIKQHQTIPSSNVHLPERPVPPTFPEASLNLTSEMAKKAEQYTKAHLLNITAACNQHDNICTPKLLTGAVYAHYLLDLCHSTNKNTTDETRPKATYDLKSLEDLASEVSDNLHRNYFVRIESQAQEKDSQGVTYSDLVATMEKMSKSDIKIALAEHYSNFIQRNNDIDGVAYKDVVGLAKDAAHYKNENTEDWDVIKKYIGAPEIVAFVENAYSYYKRPSS